MPFVVKLVYDDGAIAPSWVLIERSRRLAAPRERATVFEDHETARAEAQVWKVISPRTYSVFVDPA
jgi:hypothetical protein